MDQVAKLTLVKKLEKGATANGFSTEQWTQARVKQVIEREFGVVYHQNSNSPPEEASVYLQRIGRPSRRRIER